MGEEEKGREGKRREEKGREGKRRGRTLLICVVGVYPGGFGRAIGLSERQYQLSHEVKDLLGHFKRSGLIRWETGDEQKREGC
jgi:hypothetical protein